MKMDTNQIITMTEANQNFSKAVKITDNYGKVVISKNNRPKYLLLDLNDNEYLDLTEDEIIEIVAKRVLNKYIKAFKELAKWSNLRKIEYY